MLKIKNIEVVYNEVVLVIKGLSLEVNEGEIVSLLGANGAGKSTTLKSISGLLKTEDGETTKGSILFEGYDITRSNPSEIVKKGIFQVMEGRRCIADMTIEENLRLGAHTRTDRKMIKNDIEKILKFWKISNYDLFSKTKKIWSKSFRPSNTNEDLVGSGFDTSN